MTHRTARPRGRAPLALALLLVLLLLHAGCPRRRIRDAGPEEQLAEPAPVEIDWPDAGNGDAPPQTVAPPSSQ